MFSPEKIGRGSVPSLASSRAGAVAGWPVDSLPGPSSSPSPVARLGPSSPSLGSALRGDSPPSSSLSASSPECPARTWRCPGRRGRRRAQHRRRQSGRRTDTRACGCVSCASWPSQKAGSRRVDGPWTTSGRARRSGGLVAVVAPYGLRTMGNCWSDGRVPPPRVLMARSREAPRSHVMDAIILAAEASTRFLGLD
jgi:hypothetical protein